jgi:four helix bundle protein
MQRKATTQEKRGETPFEIRERTFQFAVRVTELVRKMPRTLDAVEIGCQLLRSGTSVGANVEEAHGAESQRDFVHKMSIARKEARETRYWLRLIQAASLVADANLILPLIQESDEIVRILSTIIANTRRNLSQSSQR